MSLDWVRHNRAQLVRSGVLRQVLRVELIEQALADDQIPMPAVPALDDLLQTFWQQHPLPPDQRAVWLAQRDLSEADLAAMVSRPLRWRQWCAQQWGQQPEALFLKHKNRLDVATLSLLRLEDEGLARELYLQLAEGESSFAEIARAYCNDQPQRQGGQWGPRPLSDLPPPLAEMIRTTPVGQLRGPERLGPGDWVVLRVEAYTRSRLDDPAVQKRLLQLEGEAWLNQWIERWLGQSAEAEVALQPQAEIPDEPR